MDLIDKAIIFAVKAHSGQTRKLADTPYILHPMEVAAIVATMTSDRDVMSAGVLHDTVEDCGVSIEEIKTQFGSRVAKLVASETENKYPELPAAQTWKRRKEESIAVLREADDFGVKILWLADKLSNMRSFVRMYRKSGEALWSRLHQADPKAQGWYYKEIKKCLGDLSDTAAYKEYSDLIDELFGKEE